MTDIPGAAYKATCRVASTANITTLSGLLTIDGIVLVANDRWLKTKQHRRIMVYILPLQELG
jgi:hypothetical protein